MPALRAADEVVADAARRRRGAHAVARRVHQLQRRGKPLAVPMPQRRGLHSFTSQLNLSAFDGIGGARRDCVARVKGVLGGVKGA